jgi:hypothetical protein
MGRSSVEATKARWSTAVRAAAAARAARPSGFLLFRVDLADFLPFCFAGAADLRERGERAEAGSEEDLPAPLLPFCAPAGGAIMARASKQARNRPGAELEDSKVANLMLSL